MSEPTRFGSIIKQSGVASLLEQADHLNALQAQLQSVLPDELRTRVRVANLRDDLLVIFVADAACATRLRFDQYRILEALAPVLPDTVTRMETRVRPEAVG